MGKIIAIGGEEVGILQKDGTNLQIVTEPAHKEVLAQTGKKHPKVLYIPTAKNDRQDFVDGFTKYYTNLGSGGIKVLRLLYEKPSLAEITEKILWADAIYVNGGNTHRAIVNWKRCGVDKLLKQAYDQGTVLSGHSAGASCWFKYLCCDPYGKAKPFRMIGLGIIDAMVCPHYDTYSYRRTALKKMTKRTPDVVAVAIDEYAAIEIVDQTYRVIAPDQKSQVNRTFWKNGTYFVENIPATKEFQDINNLLTIPTM
ncbi:MAG TPA: Type 1 glutamine amidotransferase-like domain-containing protein [Candidatus Saccharimonadales bacterium]|nr:Type 1 glutamine amidotransferase-like domain-containing protein [Candidatus Saccharimonadales bacterium]